jgi:hypothetical protein
VEFLLERELIVIKAGHNLRTNLNRDYGKRSFVLCNFDIRLLPVKFNLPMVCKPVSWEDRTPRDPSGKPQEVRERMVSDLTGGYLSTPTMEVYNRFRLLSSHDLSHFNIRLHESRCREMCSTLNGIQSQGFEINRRMLNFIIDNRAILEEVGLLAVSKLAYVRVKECLEAFKYHYLKNPEVHNHYNLQTMMSLLINEIQRARFEDFVIQLASAYEGYVFYLPVFMLWISVAFWHFAFS